MDGGAAAGAARTPLWRPTADRIARSQLMRFVRHLAASGVAPPLTGEPETQFHALHAWSVAQPAAFWGAFADFCGVIGDRGTRVLDHAEAFPGARWFADTRLNYAENLLAGPADDVVLVARDEALNRRTLTRGALRAQVAAVAALLEARGVQPGDTVAGFLSNGIEAVVAMLATTSLGAVWTSTSPDFGADGVVDRFGQARARVLFAVTGYRYAGKPFDCRAVVEAVVTRVPSLDTVILVTGPHAEAAALTLPGSVSVSTFGAALAHRADAVPRYRRIPFDAPLFVMYSSGTTGKPKAIVHGVGGTLLQHRKEHLLHGDVKDGDVLFFFTTCGWMMWNWLMSGLASGATLLLFDGAPTHDGAELLWRIAEQERVAHFGTSPRYLAAVEKAGYAPCQHHDLSPLRTLLSTGSPLSPAQFEFVYRDVKADLHLASISGGTDILSCFCLGVPWLPVVAGEIQGPGLGMAVEVVDVQGKPVRDEQGELTCAAPFPSAPLGFLDDADGARYRRAYFERFPGRWHHGDYAIHTSRGGFVILGRSDAVLNPGGVRIGTAEIYRQVEKVPEVIESIAIGQRAGGDERVVLFVRLAEGATLDDALERRIRNVIRVNTTPRHVPARIVAVADLPRTLSGKLVEIAVRNVVHGQPVENRDALANPACLELFRDLPALRE